AARTAETAAAEVSLLAGEHSRLAAVTVPAGVTELDARRRAAVDAAAVAAAEQAHRQRQDELEETRRANVVAGLRPHLVAGAPCPVCAQDVATLPAPLPAGEVDAAQSRLAEVARTLATAQAAARKADAAAVRADEGPQAGARRRTALAGNLTGLLAGPLAPFPLAAAKAAAAADGGHRDGLLDGALAEVNALIEARREADRAAEAT